MIAHDRNFFTTRFSCNSRFWLVDSSDNVIATKLYADFKQKPLSMNMSQIYKINLSPKNGEISIKVLIIYYKFETNYIIF